MLYTGSGNLVFVINLPGLLQALGASFPLWLSCVNKTHYVGTGGKCLFSADVLKTFHSLACTGFLHVCQA